MFTKEMSIVADQAKQLLELFPLLNTIENSLTSEYRNDLPQAADVTFLCRKVKELLQSVEKRLNALEKTAVGNAVELLPVIPEDKGKCKTEYCTISDNSSFYVKYPTSPDKEGYEEFVKQLPIEAIRPHYPTISEIIAKQLADGGQIPFGLPAFGIVSVEPKLRVTSHREL